MKKIFLFLLVSILMAGAVLAQSGSNKSIKFDNKVFYLKFSEYSNATKSYINHYYTSSETPDKWTDSIGVYHIKNYSKPFEYAKDIASAASKQTPLDPQVMYNKKEDTAIANFILVGETTNNRYLEQNIFKIKKVRGNSGIMAIQYAHRYPLNNKDEADKFKEQLPNNQAKWLNEINQKEIPNLVERDIK